MEQLIKSYLDCRESTTNSEGRSDLTKEALVIAMATKIAAGYASSPNSPSASAIAAMSLTVADEIIRKAKRNN